MLPSDRRAPGLQKPSLQRDLVPLRGTAWNPHPEPLRSAARGSAPTHVVVRSQGSKQREEEQREHPAEEQPACCRSRPVLRGWGNTAKTAPSFSVSGQRGCEPPNERLKNTLLFSPSTSPADGSRQPRCPHEPAASRARTQSRCLGVPGLARSHWKANSYPSAWAAGATPPREGPDSAAAQAGCRRFGKRNEKLMSV